MAPDLVLRFALIALSLSLCTFAADQKCLSCQFLVETFSEGLRRTAKQHFAGGDTAWEEKNLGRYATSETRLIEIVDHVCKKATLKNADNFSVVKDLEFKCSHIMEEHEELVEQWYYKKQDTPMHQFVCVDELKVCCASGHYGKACSQCPGLSESSNVCFGHGKCNGDGTRSGTGKCECEKGYIGLLCRQCDTNYYATSKTDTTIECAVCHDYCSGGCSGPSAADCADCKLGFLRNARNECEDIDECSDDELKACTKENERCVNSIGSYRCECVENYVRNEKTQECELDITAAPPSPFVRPDYVLRLAAIVALFIAVVLVVSLRSTILYVLLGVTVVIIICIDLYIRPDDVPSEVREHFEM